ncbi:MAG: type III secretion protein [Chlamydiae bacterium CG10_big_fil_rev_8_21_14_0_10_35_9]|nr:MAG: type III secretion protein [Chlamydiae bacterium CG10_big_fil_rev_8_21_14_0_10_35_9]
MHDLVSATDSYLNLYLSFSNITPVSVLSYFLLTLFRIVPIVVLAPFWGGKNLPAPIKIMFSISICAILLPKIMLEAKAELPMDIFFVGYAMKELLIGFILGFLVTIPFYIAQNSGTLVDHMRGASSLQVTDPTTQTQTGSIGIFYNYVLIAVFFSIDGPFIFLQTLVSSFDFIPVNKFLNPIFFNLKIPVWKLVISLFNHVMSLAIQLAAPSIVGILMAEMFLGIANRLAPQVQIVFLGIPLKSWLGLLCLTIAWYFIVQQLGKESLNWVKTIDKLIDKVPSY